MALQAVSSQARYGFIPGSADAMNGPFMNSPLYQGIASLIEPGTPGMDSFAFDQRQKGWDQQNQKFDMWKKLFGNLTPGMGQGNSSFQYHSPNIPAPQYISTGPVWTQQQINSQANMQRNNLLTQANNQSRQFTQGLGSRGFSPMSMFGDFNSQNNLMHANAAAANNETQLNFNSAQANKDAELKAAGINAGLYGDYTRNLMGEAQAQNQFNLQSRGLQNDYLGMLMKGMA